MLYMERIHRNFIFIIYFYYFIFHFLFFLLYGVSLEGGVYYICEWMYSFVHTKFDALIHMMYVDMTKDIYGYDIC